MRTEVTDKWVRGWLGQTPVVDSRAPVLFWEEIFPVPSYAFARSDVRTDLLVPSAAPAAGHGFHFHRPHGPVSQWFDLSLDGRLVPRAAWVRDSPELRDLLVLSWQPGLLDRWTEEAEEVGEHPRDPHKRVEALASTRHVEVSREGVMLADSSDPVLLFETGLPTRYYLPREDVRLSALLESSNRTRCPYKGEAQDYWDIAGQPDAASAAWSYLSPFPAVNKIAGRIAFYNELVDISVDGVAQDRPVSPFSTPAQRPVS